MDNHNFVNVEVLLATYNGAKFLPDFLKSLDQQTHSVGKLLFRDDGSKDSTVEILEGFVSNTFVVEKAKNNSGNLGVIGNFSCLMEESKAKYLLLADQDDIWYPDKIEKSIAAIRKLEIDDTGLVQPALVFTDLHVVDADLNLIHASFIDQQRLGSLRAPNFRQLLTQNVAPGCTMIVNRALLDLALPISKNVAMHDWWLMQVASLFGRIGYINEPTVAYRQHGHNQVGAASRNLFVILKDILKGGWVYRHRSNKAKLQASILVARYANNMQKDDLNAASTFSRLSSYPIICRQLVALKSGLKKSDFVRSVGFYFYM